MEDSRLRIAFIVKICVTALMWFVPLIAFPASLLEAIGVPVGGATLFLRLLGVAYAALIVAYAAGAGHCAKGSYPSVIVRIGIVSNGGSFLCLIVAAFMGEWAGWGELARVYMWASLALTFLLAAAFVIFGPVAHRGKS